MWKSRFTRDRNEADALVASAPIGRTSSYGRITETLMGAEVVERERDGRPLYLVKYDVHNHDPLFDGNLSRAVRDARARFVARSGAFQLLNLQHEGNYESTAQRINALDNALANSYIEGMTVGKWVDAAAVRLDG